MKRRDFIFRSIFALVGMSATIKETLAEIVWVKQGVSGYKEVSPEIRMKKNEKCITCKWFKDDGKVKGGGLCNLKAVSKGKVVYVKEEGICSMWGKKV